MRGGGKTTDRQMPKHMQTYVLEFACPSFWEAVTVFPMWPESVAVKWSRTYFRAGYSWTPVTPEMHYKASSTILRPSTSTTSQIVPQGPRHRKGETCLCIFICTASFVFAVSGPLHRQPSTFPRGVYQDGDARARAGSDLSDSKKSVNSIDAMAI